MLNKFFLISLMILPLQSFAQDVEWKEYKPNSENTENVGSTDKPKRPIDLLNLDGSQKASQVKVRVENGEGKRVPLNAMLQLTDPNNSLNPQDIELLAFQLKLMLKLKNEYSFTPKGLLVVFNGNEGRIILSYTAENSYGGTVSDTFGRSFVKDGNEYKIIRE
jgi:hypothetical protein